MFSKDILGTSTSYLQSKESLWMTPGIWQTRLKHSEVQEFFPVTAVFGTTYFCTSLFQFSLRNCQANGYPTGFLPIALRISGNSWVFITSPLKLWSSSLEWLRDMLAMKRPWKSSELFNTMMCGKKKSCETHYSYIIIKTNIYIYNIPSHIVSLFAHKWLNKDTKYIFLNVKDTQIHTPQNIFPNTRCSLIIYHTH